MARDSFPDKEMLQAHEVMHLLSMDRSSFAEFTKQQPLFPKAVVIGKTKKGGEIRRYRKCQVLAFIDLIGS